MRKWLVQPDFLIERDPARCIQCEVCVRQCANDVHEFDADLGEVFSDGTNCVGCHRCASMCPTHAIAFAVRLRLNSALTPTGRPKSSVISTARLRTVWRAAHRHGHDQPLPVYWDRMLFMPVRSPISLRSTSA